MAWNLTSRYPLKSAAVSLEPRLQLRISSSCKELAIEVTVWGLGATDEEKPCVGPSRHWSGAGCWATSRGGEGYNNISKVEADIYVIRNQ